MMRRDTNGNDFTMSLNSGSPTSAIPSNTDSVRRSSANDGGMRSGKSKVESDTHKLVGEALEADAVRCTSLERVVEDLSNHRIHLAGVDVEDNSGDKRRERGGHFEEWWACSIWARIAVRADGGLFVLEVQPRVITAHTAAVREAHVRYLRFDIVRSDVHCGGCWRRERSPQALSGSKWFGAVRCTAAWHE